MSLGSRASQHSFAQTPSVHIQRSKFDRSFGKKTTFDFDGLVPCFVDEILPGDTINLNVHSFGRLTTQIRPIMDNMKIDWFFFFVPNRLVWNNFEKFMGQQNDPGDSTDYLIPTLDLTFASSGFTVMDRADQFGIPPGVANTTQKINSLPFRAYNLIWNEWFRDQNLQDSLVVDKDDGPDDPRDYVTIERRNKRPDYFTSAFVAPQKGAAVTIPLSSSAAVVSNQQGIEVTGSSIINSRSVIGNTGSNGLFFNGPAATDSTSPVIFGNVTGLKVSDAAMGTIEQLRQAIQMQSLLELNMRGGTRYIEVILAHFRVVSPDFRLQRPEYLGGGQTIINANPVAQTTPTDDSPQASLAAFGTTASTGSRVGFSHSFVEHGYVIGLMCARGEVTYQQGLNRMWSVRTKYDLFWPKLQELGEQPILNQELVYGTNTTINGTVWGYNERYAHYRYRPSEICGLFRSTAALSLDVWHLAEEFAGLPPLGPNFITLNTPIERTLAVEDQADLLMDMYFQYHHTRPMVTYPTPAHLGRF